MSLPELAGVLSKIVKKAPSLCEIWMENGRFVLAGTGVLVLSILDIKERPGLRQMICDGGRTMNALISTWERHALIPLERRSGTKRLTGVYGPTCMAFDQIARIPLPVSMREGDRLIWLDAGAYHLPWETRFSHRLAEIWWHDADRPMCVRKPNA
jgi:diaminopimelate decarboxylase